MGCYDWQMWFLSYSQITREMSANCFMLPDSWTLAVLLAWSSFHFSQDVVFYLNSEVVVEQVCMSFSQLVDSGAKVSAS